MSSRSLWLLAALCATSAFWRLGHPLWEIDDARYAQVPAEMVASGDWATPHLNGFDYVEKPPMVYWPAAVSYKIFGVSEAAARLPLALFSVIGAALLVWLGAWLYSLETGLVAAAALSSCVIFFFHSHYITPDLGLTVWLLASMALTLRAALRPADARWAAPAAWFFMGVAVLGKGLIGVLFPAGWAVLCWILLPGMRTGLRRLLHPLGPVLLLAAAGPWLWIMERRHPGFLHFFFVEQHFQRYLTMKYNRWAPWYYFIPVLAAGLLPWTWHAAAGLRRSLRDLKSGDERGAALVLWAAMILAFFSASRSKLVSYILPIVPQLCLLAARALEGRRALVRRLAAGAMLIWGVVLWGGGRWADGQLSALAVSRAIASKAGPEDLVYTYNTYVHGLPFYTRRRVDKMVNWVGELHYAKRDPAHQDRFGDDADIMALPLRDKKVFVVVEGRQAAYFLTLPKSQPKTYLSYGRWFLAEF